MSHRRAQLDKYPLGRDRTHTFSRPEATSSFMARLTRQIWSGDKIVLFSSPKWTSSSRRRRTEYSDNRMSADRCSCMKRSSLRGDRHGDASQQRKEVRQRGSAGEVQHSPFQIPVKANLKSCCERGIACCSNQNDVGASFF